jgi:hypothetical protein
MTFVKVPDGGTVDPSKSVPQQVSVPSVRMPQPCRPQASKSRKVSLGTAKPGFALVVKQSIVWSARRPQYVVSFNQGPGEIVEAIALPQQVTNPSVFSAQVDPPRA